MNPVTADVLYLLSMERPLCSWGCPGLDRGLGGGVPDRGICEIAGPAGAGKTQICLQLSFQCQLPTDLGGLGGAVAYLCCGEGEFPITRYCEIVRQRLQKPEYASLHSDARNSNKVDNTEVLLKRFLDNLHIEKCHDIEDVLYTVLTRIPSMQNNSNFKLIIIDSVAGLVRSDYDTRSASEMNERTQALLKLSRALRWLSDTFAITVVVINQVTACVSDERGSAISSGLDATQPSEYTSALGLAWSHCINTRLMIDRISSANEVVLSKRSFGSAFPEGEGDASMSSPHMGDPTAPPPTPPPLLSSTRPSRRISVAFSPTVSRGVAAFFDIAADGVRGMSARD